MTATLIQPVDASPVRVAGPGDRDAVEALARLMHAEVGMFRLNPAKLRATIALGIEHKLIGIVGGPTAADGINAGLAHLGAPTGVTGGGDNSSQPGADSWGASTPASVYGPGGGQSGDAPAAPAASNGFSPLDPHADAMAAYQAALAGMNRGSGTTASTTDAPRPLVIHGRPVRAPAPTPLYRPMEDPIIRRALGLD